MLWLRTALPFKNPGSIGLLCGCGCQHGVVDNLREDRAAEETIIGDPTTERVPVMTAAMII
jgi:hypothetical protein